MEDEHKKTDEQLEAEGKDEEGKEIDDTQDVEV